MNNSNYIRNKLKDITNREEIIKILTECLPFIRSIKKFDDTNNIYKRNEEHFRGTRCFEINSDMMSLIMSEHNNGNFGFFKSASVGTFDQREYWKSLKIFPYEITIDLFNTYVYPENYEEIILKNKFKNKDVGYLATKLDNLKNYDVIFSSEENTIKNNYFCINKADAYCDIKIYGATYAKIVLSNFQEIPMDYNKEGEYFTFNDITIENPLFPSIEDYDGEAKIYTNGKKYNLKKIYVNTATFTCYSKLTNSYCLTWFPSKNLVMCNGFSTQPSFICNIDEMIQTEFNENN